MSIRNLSEFQKDKIAGRQYYKCTNRPEIILRGLKDFECSLWNIDNENLRGSFDGKGYKIDHIIEISVDGIDSESNLRALCERCHKEKTRRSIKRSRN